MDDANSFRQLFDGSEPESAAYVVEVLGAGADIKRQVLVLRKSDIPIWFFDYLAGPDLESEPNEANCSMMPVTLNALRWEVARHPKTPPATLAKLADRQGDYVSEVGRNPATPLETLERLVTEKRHVRYVLSNPSMPVDRLEHYFDMEDLETCHGIAMNPNAPHHLLRRIVKHPNVYVRKDAIRYGHLPVDILSDLLQDESEFIRNAARKKLAE